MCFPKWIMIGKLGSYLCVAMLYFFASGLLAFLAPATSGDWHSYGLVAENIYAGNGVSFSLSSPYMPTFGGNSFPGYPAFCALIWLLFGKSLMAIRLAQGLVLAVSIAYFAYAIDRLVCGSRRGLTTGMILAVSPLMLGWPSSLQPLALAMSAVLLFFAGLFISLSDNRVRVLALTTPLVAISYLRMEGFLLFFPLLSLLFASSFPRKKTVKRIILVGVLMFSAIGLWFVRNIAVGLNPIFPTTMIIMSDNKIYPSPHWYVLWAITWMTNESERAGWGYPVTRAVYDKIYIPPNAYDTPEEQRRVEGLLEELKENHLHKPFPDHINQQFKLILLEKIRNHPVRTFVVLPLKRMFSLWVRSGNSFGLPVALKFLDYEDRIKLQQNIFKAGWNLFKANPVQVSVKALVQLVSIVALIFGIVGLVRARKTPLFLASCAVAFYAIEMTCFLAFSNNVESRYMTLVMAPWHFPATCGLLGIGNIRKS